ncbi:FUSC family protein [Glycomyces tenuis]|uniref:FUSC family protein n=1 Tax=Glycomyces tenuis TaxID=58116 RepID=UPI0003F96591|nr:FUSC family protein [Glycomyces tenuis]
MRVRSVWDGVLGDAEDGGRFLRGMGRSGSAARETAKQALKAGLAAVAAWTLAAHALGLPMPYVAPWAAMIMVRTTVYWSVLSAGRQVASVALGVVLAYLAGVALPTTELALAVLVPVAVLAGQWKRLDDQGMYVPFTALFMVTIGGLDGPYILSRLAETALGALTGAAVNLLVFPPVRVGAAGDETRRVGEEEGRLLREMAEGVRGEWGAADTRDWVERADRLDERVWELGRALRRGRESLRLNPRRPRSRYLRDADRYRAAAELVGRTTDAVQTIANSLHHVSREDMPYRALDEAFSAQYAGVLDAAADALEERVARLVSGRPDIVAETDPAAATPVEVLDALERELRSRRGESAEGVELKGALLVAARQLHGELAA